MVGAEIEIEPVGSRGNHGHHDGHDHGHDYGHDHGHRAHVAVVDRPVAGGTAPSLVFGELTEGSYELYDKGCEQVLLTAGVTGGQVTFVDWPVGSG
jgi:hypothetical protein